MSIGVRNVLAAIGFLFVAAFFLAAEHRAHLFGLLPYLLLLACPLLHLMHGHGGHGGHGESDSTTAEGHSRHASAGSQH